MWVYGAKWSVCTLSVRSLGSADWDKEEVRVCVFAMPIMRTDDWDEVGREKREMRDWEVVAMWSNSSRTRMLRNAINDYIILELELN